MYNKRAHMARDDASWCTECWLGSAMRRNLLAYPLCSIHACSIIYPHHLYKWLQLILPDLLTCTDLSIQYPMLCGKHFYTAHVRLKGRYCLSSMRLNGLLLWNIFVGLAVLHSFPSCMLIYIVDIVPY